MMTKESSEPRLGHRERLRRREVLREVDGGIIHTEDMQGVDLTTIRMRQSPLLTNSRKDPGYAFPAIVQVIGSWNVLRLKPQTVIIR